MVKLDKDKIELQLLMSMKPNINGYATYLKRLIAERVAEKEESKTLTEEEKQYVTTEVLIERLSLIAISFATTLTGQILSFQGRYPNPSKLRDASLHITFAALHKAVTDKEIRLAKVYQDRKDKNE